MREHDNEKATAAYSGLSVALLRKRRLLGLPPEFIRVGRRVLYSRRAIDLFLESNIVHPRSGDRSGAGSMALPDRVSGCP